MLGAVYLDPRYNILLSVEQKRCAVVNLTELWCRIYEMNPSERNANNENREFDDFEQYLASFRPTEETSIVNQIQQFSQRPKISYKTNIIEYWNHIKIEEPDLFRLATTLFAVAVSQTPVEHSFLQLAFIFNCYRTRLNLELLNQILLIRMNYDLSPGSKDFHPSVEGKMR